MFSLFHGTWIFQDPVAWSDVTSFDLADAALSPVHHAPVKLMRIQHSDGAMECQFNVSVVLDGKKSSDEEEAEMSNSSNVAKFSTPPAILRKKKKLRGEHSPVHEQHDGLCSNALNIALKQTPVKTLPFSPSQVNTIVTISPMINLVLLNRTDKFCSLY